MGAPVLDPYNDDPIPDLARRVYLLEQGPKVAPAIAIDPYPQATGVDSLWRVPITGAAYAAAWNASSPRIPRPGIRWTFPWSTDAGTTGSVRLRAATYSGTFYTSAVALAAASSGTVTWNWLHNTLPWTSVIALSLEAYRVGGGGTVYIGAPEAWFVDPSTCTLTGL